MSSISDLRQTGKTIVEVDGERWDIRAVARRVDAHLDEPVVTLDNVERLLKAANPTYGVGFLPLDRLIVNGLEIPSTMLQAQSLDHNIDEGTLTVTFLNVRTVETIYRHMEA